jgi:hypothetical protein
MKSKRILSVLLSVLILVAVSIAGLAFYWAHYLYSGAGSARVFAANSNDVRTVQAEIDSPDFRRVLAHAADVSQWRARHIVIEVAGQGLVWKVTKGGNKRLADALHAYLSCRAEGHSAEYCRDAMALGHAPASTEYGFLDDIRRQYGGIPRKWIHDITSPPDSPGGHTATVVVLDGELAWSYSVSYGNAGSILYVISNRIDAVEFSQEYKGVIGEVEGQIAARVANEKIHGLGSCHEVWRIKQDLLKERGVIWRPPSVVNPDTCYD